MPWTPPTINDFDARFPELADHSSEFKEIVLEESISEVGSNWIERDRSTAILFRTAHFVSQYGGNADEELGQPIDANGGVIKSRTVGDVTTSYGKNSTGSSGSSSGSRGSSLFSSTRYGQEFLRLMRRSFPPVLVV